MDLEESPFAFLVHRSKCLVVTHSWFMRFFILEQHLMVSKLACWLISPFSRLNRKSLGNMIVVSQNCGLFCGSVILTYELFLGHRCTLVKATISIMEFNEKHPIMSLKGNEIQSTKPLMQYETMLVTKPC